MSKLFDKGGVHGMLMHNLRCVPHIAGIALSADGLIDPLNGLPVGTSPTETEHVSLAALKEQFLNAGAVASKSGRDNKKEVVATVEPFTENNDAAMKVEEEEEEEEDDDEKKKGDVPAPEDKLADLVDIAAWVSEINLSADALMDLTITPQFDEWRTSVGNSDSSIGLLDPRAFVESANVPTSIETEAEEEDIAMSGNMEIHGAEENNAQAASITSEAAFECMRSSSAVQVGFYDVSCLPFEGMSDSAMAQAKMRRTTALLSATSSSSSTMYDVMAGCHVSQGSAVSDPSPDEMEGLNNDLTPETQECFEGNYDDNGGNWNTCNDCDDNDAEDNAPFDQFAGIEDEIDDCDEDGNYISSQRRARMQAPPIGSQSSNGTNSRRSILGKPPAL